MTLWSDGEAAEYAAARAALPVLGGSLHNVGTSPRPASAEAEDQAPVMTTLPGDGYAADPISLPVLAAALAGRAPDEDETQ